MNDTHREEYQLYVGIDWASAAHRVIILDAARGVVADQEVAHTGAALAALADELTARAGGDAAAVAVAIEVPRGPVVETLLERGFAVYALNPKQLDRFRDRYSVAGAKDDRRDARVAAEALITDRAAFRRVRLEEPGVIRLRELGRTEAELQQELTRLANRLREQLLRYYPQALALCPAADEPWFWALLAVAPSPAAAERLALGRVRTLLRAHRIRRLTAEAVLAPLHTPALRVAPGTAEAASETIGWLLPRLELVARQRQVCARRVQEVLDQLTTSGQPSEQRDVLILRSVPGIGRVVAATLLGEAAAEVALRDYHALRTHAGLAPVTKQSGKRRNVQIRYACHARLRVAFYHWGRVSVQRDPRSRAHYTQLRQRGHSHARALRGVVDRLLAMLMAMLRTQTCYDPSRRQPLAQTA
ncbi:MAG: IS110 family transposase [candidate division NC10 bacterium]|nr:IS110 family transposase [candidate division NC10 bacterium]